MRPQKRRAFRFISKMRTESSAVLFRKSACVRKIKCAVERVTDEDMVSIHGSRTGIGIGRDRIVQSGATGTSFRATARVFCSNVRYSPRERERLADDPRRCQLD